jgi:predicted transcriptional regulator
MATTPHSPGPADDRTDVSEEAPAGDEGSEGQGSDAPVAHPTENELFDVLSNRRRRYALHVLTRRDGAVELGPLAEQVAAWENGVVVDEVTPAERKRVYTALQQSHLPKLDDVGVVDFDKRAGTITPTPAFEQLDVYLDVVQGSDIPWSEYYLGLAAVGAALLVGGWVDAPVIGGVPDLALACVVVAAFCCSAVGHVYYTRQVRLGGRETPSDVPE